MKEETLLEEKTSKSRIILGKINEWLDVIMWGLLVIGAYYWGRSVGLSMPLEQLKDVCRQLMQQGQILCIN